MLACFVHAIHGLTVVLATNREEGSKPGGAGGAGL